MARHSFLRLAASFLIALLVTAAQVRAEPVQWTYTTTVTTTGPSLDFGSHTLVGSSFLSATPPFNSKTRVEFTDMAGQGAGPALVPAFQMRAIVPAVPFPPNFSGDFLNWQQHNPSYAGLFSADLHKFDVAVRITDKASGASGALTFGIGVYGGINGLSSNGTYGTELLLTQVTPQGLKLGHHIYSVAFPYYYLKLTQQVWPPPPGSPATAAPTLNVPMYVYAAGDVPPKDTPEPASLALLASGLSALGVHAWRRRLRAGPNRGRLQRRSP
jgi:hypothetical protein